MTKPWFNPEIQRAIRLASTPENKTVLTSQIEALSKSLFPKYGMKFAQLGITPVVNSELNSKIRAAAYIPPMTGLAKMSSAIAIYGASEKFSTLAYARALAGVQSGDLDIDEEEFDYSDVAPEIESAIASISDDDSATTGTLEERRKAARIAVTWTLTSILFALYIVFPELKNAVETAKYSKGQADGLWQFLASRLDKEANSEE